MDMKSAQRLAQMRASRQDAAEELAKAAGIPLSAWVRGAVRVAAGLK